MFMKLVSQKLACITWDSGTVGQWDSGSALLAHTRPNVILSPIVAYQLVWFPDPSCMGGVRKARKEREGRVW